MKTRLVLAIQIMILVAGLGWHKTLAQSEEEEYFVDTGHRITGEFLVAFRSVPNPLQLYGYPITDAFLDTSQKGFVFVQYFQKARLDLHPDAPPGKRVQISPLGLYLYAPGQSIPIADSSPACRTFIQTSFQVCYSFLAFFEANGGEAQFGFPISNFEIHSESIVQYFERARFEWRPELPAGQRVGLTDLGVQFFYQHGENPARLLPDPDTDVIKGIVSLRVSAFPGQAVTALSGRQIIYVIVQDQRRLPVSEARVTLVVRMPSGKESRHIIPDLTNEDGITLYTFPFSDDTVGEVVIQVTARREKYEAKTTTSFRLWW